MPDPNTADVTIERSARAPRKIAIVGAGWFGVHTALRLAEEGYEVHLYDANEEIFSGISGTYGIRLHKGLHYPRSEGTQASCREGYDEFTYRYPDLLARLKHAVYAYKAVSDEGVPSKASEKQFRKAAKKAYFSHKSKEIEKGTLAYPYTNVDLMFDVPEPVIKTGKPLRDYFREELAQAGVKLHLSTKVSHVTPSVENPGLNLFYNYSGAPEYYDKVINATAYKALLPKDTSSELFEVRYQPLVSIVYKQRNSGKPITFIVMDLNTYPCFMHRAGGAAGEHILTHAKWTTLGSYKTLAEAEAMVDSMTSERYEEVHRRAETSMRSFYPTLLNDFEFVRIEPATIMPKIRSDVEFRSSVVFEDKEYIHIFPGKVSNVFEAAEQVLRHIKGEQSLLTSPLGNFRYTESSPLKEYFEEVTTLPLDKTRSTCDTNPYPEWKPVAHEEQRDDISPTSHSSSSSCSSSASDSSYRSCLPPRFPFSRGRLGLYPPRMDEDSSPSVSPRGSITPDYSSLSPSSSYDLSHSGGSGSSSDAEGPVKTERIDLFDESQDAESCNGEPKEVIDNSKTLRT